MTTDLLARVHAADPAGDRVPAPERAARMDDRLELLLAGTPAAAAPPARIRRSERRPGRATATVALAACAVGAVAALPAGDGDGAGPAPAPLVGLPAASADAVLRQARTGMLREAGSGPWSYLRTQEFTTHMYGGGAVAVVPSVTESWFGPGDELRVRTTTGDDVVLPTAADREAAASRPPAPPLPGDGRVVTQRFDGLFGPGAGGLDAAGIRALPTDPDALAARLREAAGGLRGLTVGGVASALLRTPVTPAPVRAALLAVLERTADAQLVTGVRDPRGRTGDAVVFRTDAWTTLLLFDRATGALLGTQSLGRREVPGRKTEDWQLVLDAGRREAAPAPELRRRLTPGPGEATRVDLVPAG